MKNELLTQLNQLQAEAKNLETSLDLDTKTTQLQDLQSQMEDPDFWNDQTKAQQVSQQAAHTQQFLDQWHALKSTLQDLPELLQIAEDKDLPALNEELQNLEAKLKNFETQTFLSGPYDNHDVILSIHTGNGGQDAEDFSQMLMRMYLRFSEQKNYSAKILDESPSDAGIKSTTLEISGPNAYGLMKSEHGVHRLIRLSPFNAKNLRQTSFSRVEILPAIQQDSEIEIAEEDLRIDVFRSSGAGGQSVNTTDSAVRITYLPLNLVVTCQNEKSQLQNKQQALKVLKSRLLQLKLEQQAEEIKELRGDMLENSFGSQIRTYTLQPYKLVKDHRTNFEHANPDKVFDGDLEGFMESFLRLPK